MWVEMCHISRITDMQVCPLWELPSPWEPSSDCLTPGRQWRSRCGTFSASLWSLSVSPSLCVARTPAAEQLRGSCGSDAQGVKRRRYARVTGGGAGLGGPTNNAL